VRGSVNSLPRARLSLPPRDVRTELPAEVSIEPA
jgi:hypothetical protein